LRFPRPVGLNWGTSFRGAVVDRAVFAGAALGRSRFYGNLARAAWANCSDIRLAWFADDRWRDPTLQDILTTANGATARFANRDLSGVNLDGANLRGADFSHCDLTGATFRNADLSNANLAEVQAVQVDVSGAKLHGVCLRDWHIDADTRLDGVDCSFFFLRETEDELGNRDRRPHDGEFRPGDFEAVFREVRNTIQLIVRNGDRMGWLRGFQRVMAEFPEIGPS
jgi:uncharacterized protein YjbI with pentapeptide repeats